MNNNTFLVFVSLFFSLLLVSCSDNRTLADLPILGGEVPVYNGDSVIVDTVFHRIPAFEFTNQFDQSFSSHQLDNKIYVVDFFFTSCPSICPIMIRQMSRVRQLTNPKEVSLVSFTVDPERDTPEKLQRYIKSNLTNTSEWYFLTGEAEKIYELGWQKFKLAMAEDYNSPGGFIHSDKFILVDKDHHIRGFYSGTAANEVAQLVKDIELLIRSDSAPQG